jgi:hypothetical protein
MGWGRDLTDSKRAFVLNKIMQNWDSEKRQIKSGRRKIVLAACKYAGIQIRESTMKNIAREAKRQEDESEAYFIKTVQVKGMDHGSNR